VASAEKFLLEIVREIEPSATRKDGAQRSHRFLRDILRTGQFATRISDDYLSGSYARGTAIDPLEDVDIIFVVHPEHFQSRLSRAIGFNPSPATVLNSFQNAIRYRYPDSSVVSQRRSVGLRMYHLHIDVVPAIADSSKRDHIWIPDRSDDTWVLTGPKVHAIRATEVNQRSGGKFKPLVKLLKYWNRGLPSTAQIQSFTIETIATRIFSNYRLDSLEQGLLLFFDFVVWVDDQKTHLSWSDQCGISFFWGPMNVPDVAETGSNVAAKVDSARRKRFTEKARISRDRILQAIEATSYSGAESKMRSALRAG